MTYGLEEARGVRDWVCTSLEPLFFLQETLFFLPDISLLDLQGVEIIKSITYI